MSDTPTKPEADGPAGPDSPTGLAARGVIAVLGTLLTLAALGYAADVYRKVFGLTLTTQEFVAGMLTLALPLVFIAFRIWPSVSKDRVPWYDWLLAALAFATTGYITLNHNLVTQSAGGRPLDEVIAGAAMILLSLDALRRTTGWALVTIILVFLAFSQVAGDMPGSLQGLSASPEQVAHYLTWDNGSILGLPTQVACLIVIAFIFFGTLLSRTGGSAFFTDIAVAAMGRYRGGSAKISVVASSLFGSISGSAVSNVVSTGVVTIPLMQKGGFKPRLAAAIESVASTGGQLMPPIMGAAAFLLATMVEETYSSVVIAALLPAILYYVALFIQVDLVAARNGIKAVDRSLIPRAGRVLAMGWHYPLAFAVLIGSLFWLNAEPQTAALYASATIFVTGMLFGYEGKRLPPMDLMRALKQTGVASVDILMICVGAGMVIGILNVTATSHALAQALVEAAGGSLFLLLIMAAVVSIILGMGMPTAGVYVLLATLVAPAIEQAGVEKMAAHLYVMYFGMMSMITPPVAIAAFTAASLARTNPMATGFAAVQFGWIAYIVPFLFVLSPSLLLMGDVGSIALAVVTAVVGVWLICTGVTGYMFRALDWPTRLLAVVAGAAMLMPANAFSWAIWSDLAGACLAVLVIAKEFLMRKQTATPATPA